jgi:hypothetical protein
LNAANVRRAERVIDSSGLVAFLEDRIAQHKKVSGRPRELSVRTLLVALLLLSQSGSIHLVRVPGILNGLDAATRKRLGVVRAGGVTRRQVERLYNLIADSLAGSSYANFDAFCDLLLQATIASECAKTNSIAIDGTSIDSWGRRRKHVDPTGAVSWVSSDPDAEWRRKSKDNPWKRPVFGFDLTVAVTVSENDGPDVPLAAKVMRFRGANRENVAMGRAVVREVARQQGVLGDVIADREYTATIDGHDFVLPVRALGGEPVFELTQNQLGARGTTHGAVMIDGHPFSPSIPPALHLLVPPPPGAPWKDVAAYQQKIATREKYALVPHGSRKANGSQVFQCPAAAGNLFCPLMPSSTPGAFRAFLAPATAAAGSVCSKKFTTFQATDAPLSQRDLFGSAKWFSSMSRRSRVEGFFGNLKNEACENLRRGTIRVRGLVKTGMLVAFAVASTNLRLADSFAKRTPSAPTKKRGRPKKTGVVKYADVFTSDSAANSPPSAA